MMLGDHHRQHPIPAIQVPPWPVYDEPTSPYSPLPISGAFSTGPDSPQLSPYILGEASLAALSRFLPSNDEESDTLMDAYSCDEFRMYEFKVRRCARGRSHDWTECPYAHPGEKARRRDPRKYHYAGTACPDFRKGSCKRGDSCEFAHGVFECWLHPFRYRTQPCKDSVNCRRRVCFFAHTPEQLRVLPQQQSPRACDSYDGSPMRQQHHNTCLEAYLPKGFVMSSSPTSTLVSPPLSPPSDSPPLSPSAPPAVRRASGSCGSSSSVNEVLASLRKMQISKAKSCGCSAGAGAGGAWSGLYGGGLMDGWDEPMERVESGRDLRVKMAERLSKENPLEGGPDVGWVSDLLN